MMTVQKINDSLWYIGVIRKDLRVINVNSFTDCGIMLGSYLVDCGEGFALIGSLPASSRDDQNDLKSALLSVIRDRELKWMLFTGDWRDRSGAAFLAREFPDMTLIGGENILFPLAKSTGLNFSSITIRADRQIILGNRKFFFHMIPDPLRPSSIYIVDTENHILFTSDAFGSNETADDVLLSHFAGDPERFAHYLEETKNYNDDIDAVARPLAMKDVASLVENNEIQLICPSKGPVVDSHIPDILRLLCPDSAQNGSEQNPLVSILYAPGNFTADMALCIGQGIRDAGSSNVENYDLSSINRAEVLRAIRKSDLFVIGTPQIRQDAAKPVWDILTSLHQDECKGKTFAFFTSYGAGESPLEELKDRIRSLGGTVYVTDFARQGVLDLQGGKDAYEFGYGIGCSALKKPNDHQPLLVKCLVCGEIFEAALGICPVCGAGLDQCVPVDEEPVGLQIETDRKYIIVGGGTAAVNAADAIRRRDKTGSILLITAEQYLPINRPMLTKDFAAASGDPDNLAIHDREWYEKRNITLFLGTRVTKIHPEERTIEIEKELEERPGSEAGKPLSYDRLILATGAECFIPPFEGHDKKGVITIRHLEDDRSISSYLRTSHNVVVIGGGVLGLEAANQLMLAGLHVTVLEATPQIIGRQADAGTAAIIRNRMQSLGVACYEGVSIAAVEGTDQANGVRLADGRVFPADFVVVSCGNRGNVGIAKDAGAEVQRSIVVNERMETSLPDIYACGDCCQFEGLNYQLWQEASTQGQVAGANAAGERLSYQSEMLGLSLEGFGTSLFAMGDPGKKDGVQYQTITKDDTISDHHEKYWFVGGELQGASIIGEPEKVPETTTWVRTHARYEDIG